MSYVLGPFTGSIERGCVPIDISHRQLGSRCRSQRCGTVLDAQLCGGAHGDCRDDCIGETNSKGTVRNGKIREGDGNGPARFIFGEEKPCITTDAQNAILNKPNG